MNTTQKTLENASSNGTIKPVRRNQFLGKLALGMSMALIIAACNKSATELTPKPGDSGKPSTDTTATNPNPGKPSQDSTGTNPGKPADPKPGDSTGTNPGSPVSVYNSVKISYAPTDFQELLSDAAGTPVQYTSQYMANQGTGQTKRMVYRFLYGSDQRLNRVDQSLQYGSNPTATSYVLYTYEGNQVTHTDEYSSAGNLMSAHTYRYAANNQLIQIDESFVNSKIVSRKTYQYDGRGNVTTVSDFTRGSQDGGYVLDQTTTYGDYDNHKHVENLLTTNPFLPGITFRINNYRTKVIRYKDGREISRETVDYAYDANGLPTQRITSGAGGKLTAQYTY